MIYFGFYLKISLPNNKDIIKEDIDPYIPSLDKSKNDTTFIELFDIAYNNSKKKPNYSLFLLKEDTKFSNTLYSKQHSSINFFTNNLLKEFLFIYSDYIKEYKNKGWVVTPIYGVIDY